jgi:[amino group carrier protein]-lysine/ornithine hydrolase
MSITPETAEQLIHDLVAIPSVSTYEHNAVSHLATWMQEAGYDEAYCDDAGNAVGIRGNGPRLIVLLGHIDTFPGMPPVHIEGRKLYGRGSVDAKGPLCSFAAAGANAVLPPDVRLMVVGAVEEECPTSKGAQYIAQTIKPDACIIGEPSSWHRLTLGYKGRVNMEWRWEGDLAHSAGRTLSAGDHAFNYYRRVREYVDGYNTKIEHETSRLPLSFRQLHATITDMQYGNTGIVNSAALRINVRLPLGLTPEDVVAALPPTEGATLYAHGGEVPYAAPADTSISRVMRAAIRAEGGTPAFVYKTGTADFNVVGPVWNCPILAYGPGDSALDHTPDEHLDLDEYQRAIAVLTRALESF